MNIKSTNYLENTKYNCAAIATDYEEKATNRNSELPEDKRG